MQFTNGNLYTQLGTFYKAAANETLVVTAAYQGRGWAYAGLSDNTVRIEAPLANVSARNNGYGTKDLVLTFENGAELNFWHFFDLAGNPGLGFFEKMEIDLQPYYGLGETLTIDWTQYATWDVLLGTSGNDDFESLVESLWGKQQWEVDVNTIQLGLAGTDNMSGWMNYTDVLFGGDGGDLVDSGPGRDLLYGGIGDDIISVENSGLYDYLVSGGLGNDLYIVNTGPDALLDFQWVEGAADENGYNVWQQEYYKSTGLTPVYDHQGLNDRLLLDNLYPSFSSGPGAWSRGALQQSDTWSRFEIVEGDLEISTSLTEAAIQGNLDVMFGRQIDFWFRSEGYWDEWDGGYQWGMTESERVIFDFKDPTTYPGWSELTQAAKDWLLPRLDPAYWESSTVGSYFDFVNSLSWQVHSTTEWVDGGGTDRNNPLRLRPRVENGVDLVEQAKANTEFVDGDYDTYPYFEFSEILSSAIDVSIFTPEELGSLQAGVELLDFGLGVDSIESVYAWTSAYKEFLVDNPTEADPIGTHFNQLLSSGTPIDQALNSAIAYATGLGWFRELKTSYDGLARSDQDHLLVANQAAVGGDAISAALAAGLMFSQTEANGATLVQGAAGSDALYSKTTGKSVMLGMAGDDWFELQGGEIWAAGGVGEDTFVIRDHGIPLQAYISGGVGAVGGASAEDDRIYVAQSIDDVVVDLQSGGAGLLRLNNGTVVNFQGIESIQFDDWLIADTASPVWPTPPYELIEISGSGSYFLGTDLAEKVVVIGGGVQEVHTLGGDDFVIFQGTANFEDKNSFVSTGLGNDIIDLTQATGRIDIDAGEGNDVIKVASEITSVSLRNDFSTLHINNMPSALVVDLADGTTLNYAWNYDQTLRGSDSIVFVQDDGSEKVLLDMGASLRLGTNTNDTTTLQTSSTYLGLAGDDTVMGSNGNDTINTGSGNDVITLSLGDDMLSGGTGDDTYVIDTRASNVGMSTVLESESGGYDTIKISGDFWFGSQPPSSGMAPFTYQFDARVYIDGSDLIIGAQLEDDGGLVGLRVTDFTQRDNTVEAIQFDDKNFLLERSAQVQATDTKDYFLVGDSSRVDARSVDLNINGGAGDDVLIGTMSSLENTGSDFTRDMMFAGDGNDRLHGLSGINLMVGNNGDDAFFVYDYQQNSFIIGDAAESNVAGTVFSASGAVTTNQIGSHDVVQIGWSWEQSIFETIGAKGQRIYRKDAQGNKKEDQFVDIYDVEEVQFWDGTAFEVKSLVVPVSVDLTSLSYTNDIEFRFGAIAGSPDTIEVWDTTSGTLVSEYDRKTVADFRFSDQTVKVVQKLSAGLSDGDPGALNYVGTDAVEIVYGTKHADVIDARGGDDYVFGGEGDDVLIGGSGNDVVLGGDGSDTLRGGLSDDQIMAGEALFGTDDDLIIGGDGIDDIKSGPGSNFVASGRVTNGSSEVDLTLVNERWGGHVFNDDEWI